MPSRALRRLKIQSRARNRVSKIARAELLATDRYAFGVLNHCCNTPKAHLKQSLARMVTNATATNSNYTNYENSRNVAQAEGLNIY